MELKERLGEVANFELGGLSDSIGVGVVTAGDELFTINQGTARRFRIPKEAIEPFMTGEVLRDWKVLDHQFALFPYADQNLQPLLEEHVGRYLWPFRANLRNRLLFGKTQHERGLTWYEYGMLIREKYKNPYSIAFAEIATHNHFVFLRNKSVLNQSAPIIKLKPHATANEHLALLGILNSSTIAFWMQQVFQSKGGSGVNQGVYEESWEKCYQHDATKLRTIPVVKTFAAALPLAHELDRLANSLANYMPSETIRLRLPTSESLAADRNETAQIQRRMISLQEELDWLVYRLYGLLEPQSDLPVEDQPYSDPPGIKLGERPFEIALARAVATSEVTTSWFERFGSVPVTEIPGDWPEAYQALVAERVKTIQENPEIALIERSDTKRRWLTEPWDDQVQRALRSWLLDRLESERYWPNPTQTSLELTSAHALSELAQHDPDFLQVAVIYSGRPDFPLPKLIEELITSESVPFLPVLRYKPSGLTKRDVWERTWCLQRREDEGEDVGSIPVPPKYTSADFLSSDIWRLRGKLDVPKERFVSYPHCARDGDTSLVVGWAGWDHRQQATALAAYYDRMKSREGWPAERLMPLLAGLDQLLFWLKLWHNEVDPEFDLRMGDYYADYVCDEAQALGLTLEKVRNWTPPAKAKARRTRKTS